MSECKRSYIVRRPPLRPVQVDCCDVSFAPSGAAVFLDKDGLPVCAFSSWESVEVMSQISGQGNGWVPLKVI